MKEIVVLIDSGRLGSVLDELVLIGHNSFAVSHYPTGVSLPKVYTLTLPPETEGLMKKLQSQSPAEISVVRS